MRGWPVRLAFVVSAIALSGCLDPGRPANHEWPVSTPSGSAVTLAQGPEGVAVRGEDSYWFVHVTGGEQESVAECDRGFSYDVNATGRSVLFNPEAHPFNPSNVSGLVAYDVDRGSCPLAYGLDPDNETQQWDLGVLGEVTIVLAPDGEALVTVDGHQSRVPVGMQLRITGEGRVQQYGESWDATGEVLIVNHGAWPRAGLEATSDGPTW